MAFAVTPDLTTIVLATPRRSLKYENMIAHPAVSLLADNRDNSSDDPHTAMAVTVLGTASEVSGSFLEAMRSLFKDRHPGLGGFVTDPDTAICAVHVSRYLVVERFQDVQEILVDQDQVWERV
jgi:hypothetical protein